MNSTTQINVREAVLAFLRGLGVALVVALAGACLFAQVSLGLRVKEERRVDRARVLHLEEVLHTDVIGQQSTALPACRP